MNKLLFAMAAVAVSSGCMLSPTDGQRVTSTSAPLSFLGYVPNPNVPVQIEAWDYTTHAMANVGAPVRSESGGYALSDGSVYAWTASRVLPTRFWRGGPSGGYCAAVGAEAEIDGKSYTAISVASNWGECFSNHPSGGGFYGSCKSDHSPFAFLYTNDWGTVTIDQSRLNFAGTLASRQIRLVLNNYTPRQGQFCNSRNPAGCPPGLSSDPETYQFYAPNSSSLSAPDEEPLAFSITPTRSDPMTVYISDLRSSTIDFSTSGNQFVLGIGFESVGPEIHMNCIRNGLCLAAGDPAIDLDNPRVVIRFDLRLVAEHVVYSRASAVFTTSSTGETENKLAAGISGAMSDKLNNDASIRSAVAKALDSVIRQSGGLGQLGIQSLTIGGGRIQVVPACVRD